MQMYWKYIHNLYVQNMMRLYPIIILLLALAGFFVPSHFGKHLRRANDFFGLLLLFYKNPACRSLS